MSKNFYVPLNVHSHLSFLQALTKADDLAKQLANYNISSCAITDYNLLTGSFEFYEACKKNNVKPILGTKLETKNGYMTLIAKNLAGWKELINITSDASIEDGKSNVSLETILGTKDIVVIGGYTGSLINHADNKEELCEKFKSELGDKFFLQVEQYNKQSVEKAEEILNLGKKFGVKCVAGPRSLYINKSDHFDYKVLIASYYKSSVKDLDDKLNNTENHELLTPHFNLLSQDEAANFYSEELLKNTNLVSDMCESYSILNKPSLPKFNTPDNLSDIEYLRELCREGWKNKIVPKVPQEKYDEYVARIKYELDVIAGANLSSYFLIVQDYMRWYKSHGWLAGPARGSGGGCIVSYLTDITTIDPIEFSLLFERFYNSGRNTKDNIELPDIDCDFMTRHRQKVFEYNRNKYGNDYVAQVSTVSRLKGRGVLQEVFRTNHVCSVNEAKKITENIPPEGLVSDKLEEEDEVSLLRWTLNNDPKSLEEWCTLKDGKYEGIYGPYFEQAVRLEGTAKSIGKHASALVISGTKIRDVAPMIVDKSSDSMLVALEYKYAGKAGLPKFDILGVNILDKLYDISNLLKYGEIRN